MCLDTLRGPFWFCKGRSWNMSSFRLLSQQVFLDLSRWFWSVRIVFFSSVCRIFLWKLRARDDLRNKWNKDERKKSKYNSKINSKCNSKSNSKSNSNSNSMSKSNSRFQDSPESWGKSLMWNPGSAPEITINGNKGTITWVSSIWQRSRRQI